MSKAKQLKLVYLVELKDNSDTLIGICSSIKNVIKMIGIDADNNGWTLLEKTMQIHNKIKECDELNEVKVRVVGDELGGYLITPVLMDDLYTGSPSN
jgi:hypothetical protein